jgi:hypothetical protein
MQIIHHSTVCITPFAVFMKFGTMGVQVRPICRIASSKISDNEIRLCEQGIATT